MKVVIVGGVAGGASCAARLRRLDEKAEILMVERGPCLAFCLLFKPIFGWHISRGSERRQREETCVGFDLCRDRGVQRNPGGGL